METAYKLWRGFLDRILGQGAALILLGVTLLAVIEIFRRYIEGRTFYWSQDATTYFLLGATFLYFGVTQARRDHLSVTAITDWLKAKGYARIVVAIKLVGNLLTLAFVVGFVYWGLPAAERTMMLGRMTESMIIPLWPFQYLLLIGFIIMGISLFFQIYRDIQALRGIEVFAWDKIEDSMEI